MMGAKMFLDPRVAPTATSRPFTTQPSTLSKHALNDGRDEGRMFNWWLDPILLFAHKKCLQLCNFSFSKGSSMTAFLQ